MKRPGNAVTNSPGSVAFVFLLGALFVGMMYAFGSQFVRSESWLHASIIMTVLLALPLAILSVIQGYRTGLRGMRFRLWHGVMLTAFFCVFIGIFLFFSVAYSLPDIFTRNAGQPVELRGVEFTKKRAYGRGGCHYEIHARDFIGSVRGHYCADVSEYTALPDEGLGRAYARRTWFGLHIYAVEPEPTVAKPLPGPG